ncbi:protein-L-histidine N-pros-methyltransferase-like [Saccoglossus kowalevskii]
MSGMYIRNPLMRSLYWKAVNDQRQTVDTSKWYDCTLSSFPESLQGVFLQCHKDEETEEFLTNCYDKSDWILTQFAHVFLKMFLSVFMTRTSVNGYVLQRERSVVLSHMQFTPIFFHWQDGVKSNKLLDLGAGDGLVTKQIEKHFTEVFATEVSSSMRWRLQNHGYKILEIDEWADGKRHYDVISCLNLLDRCDKPLTLLHDIKKSLVPVTGRAIVAIVIPVKPYVESGTNDNKPSEYLPVKGRSWEEQVQSLIEDVFTSAGFTVLKFTRLPYLCEGDLHDPYYVLNDAVFVLAPMSECEQRVYGEGECIV